MDQRAALYQHLSMCEYNNALLSDEKLKTATNKSEQQLRESPRRKHLDDEADDSITQQAQMIQIECNLRQRLSLTSV
jgi:hypothetical protein